MPKPGTDLALSGPVRLRSGGCFPGVVGTSYRKPSGSRVFSILSHCVAMCLTPELGQDHLVLGGQVLDEDALDGSRLRRGGSAAPHHLATLVNIGSCGWEGHAKRESYHAACGLVLNLGMTYNIRGRKMGSL